MVAKAGQRPNVILMMADSLRADHVGCYSRNGAPSLTPNLDALAKRSAQFLNAFAQGPYTTFSMPSILTGKYPCRLKPIRRTLPFWKLEGVTVEGAPTLAQLLRAAGYHTAAFHSNPLLSRLFGFQKGFDLFYDDLWVGGQTLPDKLRLATAQLYRLFRVDPFLSAQKLNEKVFKWLAAAPEPFFLLIHYMDTHGPYLRRKVLKYISCGERAWRTCNTAPSKVTPRQRELLIRNYRSQISYLDTELAQLWQAFEAQGLFDRSLLVVSADHGDEFYEHGGYAHHYTLYDELIHVPLLVHFPGVLPGGIEDLTEAIQIAPTVLDFVGVKSAATDGFDGKSFLPMLCREAVGEKSFTYSEAGPVPHDRVCIRTQEWKLIWSQNGNQKELYRLVDDPREQVNVAANHPQVVASLEQQIVAHFVGSLSPPSCKEAESSGVSISEVEERIVEDRLRDLGYI